MSETTRTVLIALGVALLVVVLLPFPFVGGMMGMGGMMGSGGMMGQPGPTTWSGWLMLISWLVVAVGIALLLVWGVRRVDRSGDTDDEKPLAILQRRYARGEIGPEECARIRADLLRNPEA